MANVLTAYYLRITFKVKPKTSNPKRVATRAGGGELIYPVHVWDSGEHRSSGGEAREGLQHCCQNRQQVYIKKFDGYI